ncbi:phosphoribosyl-ATP diphosphatase [Azospirillum thermophilum]|uniref:Phosphoribosyl-ATP pyrophosphatase n=1 Tax=Azospirillum thermophilum TaxID=2202148 RepID=A0A2S2CNU6_9PROT|nr:phosphoribosyl-ATP diphosphatase [Azospirillum thermophilum]AWK86105.1 phosphoribosyl-ATP diphosphatase [Azospirillum thermophilum]
MADDKKADDKKSEKAAKPAAPTGEVLDRLYATVQSRKGGDPEASYTAKLFSRGTAKIAQKVGEEAVETVLEAVRGDKAAMASESADLLYHLMVLWADAGLEPAEVWDRLAQREGISGIAEKKARKS